MQLNDNSLKFAKAILPKYDRDRVKAGNPTDVRDPMAAALKSIGEKCDGNPANLVKGYTALQSIFGDDLHNNNTFINATTNALKSIQVTSTVS